MSFSVAMLLQLFTEIGGDDTRGFQLESLRLGADIKRAQDPLAMSIVQSYDSNL